MKKIFILAAATVFVLGMSAPSWAVADFAIGGNIQFEPYWKFKDLGDVEIAGEDSFTDYFGDLDGSSRINFKATVGDVTGFYELGIGSGSSLSLRHAYAEWDAGTFQLMVGRNWGLVAFGFTDLQLGWDGPYGNLYDGRNDQIRLTIPGETWAFKVAFYTARAQATYVTTADCCDLLIAAATEAELFTEEELEALEALGISAPTIVAATTEAPIPAIAAAVDFAFGEAFPITASAFFQTYELIGGAADGEDVMTWAIAANGRLNFEALYFAYQVWYAQNPLSGGFDAGPYTAAAVVGDSVEDVNAYGGFLRVVVPMETITLGAGGTIEFADYSDLDLAEDDSTRWSGYVNIIYNFTDNFYMQPEINYFDNGDNQAGTDLGNEINVGVHFQANF